MKKILALMMAVMMMVGMCAVAQADTTDEIYIGILAPATTHGWVGGVAYFAQQTADESGVKYEMITADNAEEMSAGIEQFITMGVDAIVVWPQFTGVATAAEKALDAGIIIYNFDMVIEVSDEYKDHKNLYFLSGDNKGMGVGGAKFIVDTIGTTGKVLVMDVPTSGSVAATRLEGFTETMAEIAPDIELVTIATAFAREDGKNDMADALVANPDLDAVFSMDDETSIGALQAINEAGNTTVKAITGGGGCQEYFNMMDDTEYANIAISSATYLPNMISTCVENAIKVVKGEEVAKTIVDPTNIVSLANVADFLNENSPY